jgi:hypothetical protein
MRQFMMTITAVAAFGAMMATAQADANHGGPIRNGNQCFKYSPGRPVDARFGYWTACPQGASTRAAPAAAAVPQRRSSAASR